MTERFARERVRHELVRRSLRVLRATDVAPGMRRITLGGTELEGFLSLGPADHVKVRFPQAGGDEVARDYTPVAYRAEGGDVGPRGELDLDFFLHGSDGASGPAADWAARVQPGDEIVVGGPRGSVLPPERVDDVLVVADESALPAARRWIVALPADTPVRGVFPVSDRAVASYLDDLVAEHRSFQWFDGADRHERADAALRATEIGSGTFCFAAGEALSLVPIRRYLRRELDLPKGQVDVNGYWRRGTSGHDHHAPIDPTDND